MKLRWHDFLGVHFTIVPHCELAQSGRWKFGSGAATSSSNYMHFYNATHHYLVTRVLVLQYMYSTAYNSSVESASPLNNGVRARKKLSRKDDVAIVYSKNYTHLMITSLRAQLSLRF